MRQLWLILLRHREMESEINWEYLLKVERKVGF